jgi:hypothetical protein
MFPNARYVMHMSEDRTTYIPSHNPTTTPYFTPYPSHIHSPKLFRTFCLTTFSYSSRFSRHMRAASTFAGLSSFGSASMLITLISIFSTLCIGLQRSLACSYCSGSSPGAWRIEMHTSPLVYTKRF